MKRMKEALGKGCADLATFQVLSFTPFMPFMLFMVCPFAPNTGFARSPPARPGLNLSKAAESTGALNG